jgi:hypothetical protein
VKKRKRTERFSEKSLYLENSLKSEVRLLSSRSIRADNRRKKKNEEKKSKKFFFVEEGSRVDIKWRKMG